MNPNFSIEKARRTAGMGGRQSQKTNVNERHNRALTQSQNFARIGIKFSNVIRNVNWQCRDTLKVVQVFQRVIHDGKLARFAQ